MYHFQGDGAVVAEIPGEVDRRHATAPELALNAVVVGESSWRLLRVSGNPGFWERGTKTRPD
jgi:hypothetical protein